MPLYPAPAKAAIVGSGDNPDSATARSGFGALYDFLTSLLGTTGDPADARAALGVSSTAQMNTAIAARAAGDVLQVVAGTDAGGLVTSATLTNVMVAAADITPKSAASKLLITATFQCKMWDTLYNSEFALYEDTTQLCLYKISKGHPGTVIGATRNFIPMTISAVVSNTATTPRAFRLRARDSTGYGSPVEVGATDIVYTITEIKT